MRGIQFSKSVLMWLAGAVAAIALFLTNLNTIIASIKNVFASHPPKVALVPSSVVAVAGQPVTFSAEGSSDPTGAKLRFLWTIGGKPISKSGVASCRLNEAETVATCQFALPGKQIVTVAATNTRNLTQTASASTTVDLPGGYYALVIGGNAAKNDNMVRAFNYGVDWPAVQTLLASGRPIVLFDPVAQEPVYALDIAYSVENARNFLAAAQKEGVNPHISLLTPFPPQASQKIQNDLQKISIHVNMIAAERKTISTALERGQSDSGLIPVSRPDAILRYYRRENPSKK